MLLDGLISSPPPLIATEPGTLVTTTGLYTKVGRQVTVQIDFDNVNTTGYGGDILIYGLPFPNTSSSRAMLSIATYAGASFDSGATYCVGEVGTNNTVVTFQTIRSNNSWNPAHHTGSSNAYYWITGTYQRT